MRLSVIFPSLLRPNPTSAQGGLLLDRALGSVYRQSVDDIEIELIVGLDAVHPAIPERLIGPKVKFVEAGDNQAKAVNRAMEAATGSLLAMCEEDDYWYPDKLAAQLPMLDDHDFVSCNQREMDEQGNFLSVNNFATPSGWLMKREVWAKVGGFDESFKWHVDTEWLGRANAAKVNRVHLVSAGTKPDDFLRNVGRFSKVAEVEEVTEPLVGRFQNGDNGMAKIRTDAARLDAEAEKLGIPRMERVAWAMTWGDSPFGTSMREHDIMIKRFGEVPW